MFRCFRYAFVLAAAFALAIVHSSLPVPAARAGSADDDPELIIHLSASLEHGPAPLLVLFTAEIEAPAELDELIYTSMREWRIEGTTVLHDPFISPDSTPDEMRQGSRSLREQALRSTRHLITRNRQRPPRGRYEEGMEVPRTYEFEFTFDKGGDYYVTFRLKRKYSSNEVRVKVIGYNPFDPMRPNQPW